MTGSIHLFLILGSLPLGMSAGVELQDPMAADGPTEHVRCPD